MTWKPWLKSGIHGEPGPAGRAVCRVERDAPQRARGELAADVRVARRPGLLGGAGAVEPLAEGVEGSVVAAHEPGPPGRGRGGGQVAAGTFHRLSGCPG